MNKKIIFFDIDGTLFCRKNNGITKKVKNAIKKTKEKGILCFIASGRSQGYIAENVKEISFDGYILANGAHIIYENQDLETRFLNYDDTNKLCQKLKEKQIEYVILTPGLCYLDKSYKHLLDFYKNCNIDFRNFDFDYDEKEILHQALKLEIFAEGDAFQEVIEFCHSFAYDAHEDIAMIEVYAKDVSKATGILEVLKLLKISVENSYCFGDGSNDVEMFETVGHPIAMGNAIDIIKEKAEDICLSVEEDGVAYKLKELFMK